MKLPVRLSLAAIAVAALAAGCASARATAALIPIRTSEGARWVPAERVENYGCERAALACSADGGRLTERRCRCNAVR